MRRALPALAISTCVALACATPASRQAPRPKANPGARARYACQKMADDLLKARQSARILAIAGKTGRLYADDEALEPLRKCAARLAEDPARIRVLSHALGKLIRQSKLFDPDERVALLREVPDPEVRAFWTAWTLLDVERGPAAAAAAHSVGPTTWRPLLLTRAEAELARGDPEAAELALAQAGAVDRPGLALELSAALAREQLVRADKALASWSVSGPWEPGKRDPDTLAILALPDEPPEDDACTHGALRQRRGDPEGALERFRAGACDEARVRLLLDQKRAFDALLLARSAGVDNPKLVARLYDALGQRHAAGAALTEAHSRCLRLGSPAACVHLDAEKAGYPPPRPSAPTAEPPFTLSPAEPGPAAAPVEREELGELATEDVVLALSERGRTLVVVASARAPEGLYAFLLEGKRQRGPWHLGLKPRGRYALQSASLGPLFVKGGFQLEAMDTAEKRTVNLRFSLAALQQDADRDGWTDVLERHLGTDPAARDTDGDRLPDPRDPLPLQRAADDEAGDALLKAALPALFAELPASRLPEVRYLEVGAQLLSGRGLSRPVIALPKAALGRVPGARVFAALPALALDRDKKRGLVEIRQDWRAVRTVYERKGDTYRPLPSASASGISSP